MGLLSGLLNRHGIARERVVDEFNIERTNAKHSIARFESVFVCIWIYNNRKQERKRRGGQVNNSLQF